MGGFAALLGHAAGGFEQARQQDVARQFADEQNRRAMMGELLHGIITDPNQSNELRQGAAQAFGRNLMPSKAGIGKPLDPGKVLGSLFEIGAQQRAQQQAVPPVPTPPVHQQLAAAQGQAPQAQPGQGTTPTIGALPPPPPGMMGGVAQAPPPATTQQAATPAGQVGVLPAPPPGLFAGAHQVAENAGYAAQQEAAGTTAGQIGAHQKFAQAALNDPKMAALIQADPMLSTMVTGMAAGVQIPATMYGMANRSAGEGKEIAGSDIIAQGITKTEDGIPIDPSKFYNERKRLGLPPTYTQTVGPGQQAGENGGLVSPLAMNQAKLNQRYGIWQKENATQFSQALTKIQRQYELGVNRGSFADANSAYMKTFTLMTDAAQRANTMDQNLADVLNSKGPAQQQAMVSLLMNHIGMTVPKNGRVSQQMINEAEASAPFIDNVVKRWFHQDASGDYIFDGYKQGINLSPEQMKEMVNLAHQKLHTVQDTVEYQRTHLPEAAAGIAGAEVQAGPIGGAKPPAPSKGNKKLTAPPTGNKVLDDLVHQYGG